MKEKGELLVPSVWFGGILKIQTDRFLVECQKLHNGCVHHCCSKVNTSTRIRQGEFQTFLHHGSVVSQTSEPKAAL